MKQRDEVTWSGGPGVLANYRSRGRAAVSAELHGCPELTVVLGRDGASSGVTVSMAVPSGGEYPHHRVLFAERWRETLPGEEGVIEIAIQALQACLGRLRGLQDDQV